MEITMKTNLSCDEQIIPSKGKITLKTNNAKKPKKVV